MRSQFSALFLILTVLFTGCTSAKSVNTPSKTLTVFAAASLTDVFTELVAEFEADNPQVDIVLNFAGSQTLRLQVEQGARADVFASANINHMQTLVDADLMQMPTIFTQNQLMVILPVSNPASIQSLADLTRPGTKLILAGEAVPAGKYARQAPGHGGVLHRRIGEQKIDPVLCGNASRVVAGANRHFRRHGGYFRDREFRTDRARSPRG